MSKRKCKEPEYLSVRQLIAILTKFPTDAKVVFSIVDANAANELRDQLATKLDLTEMVLESNICNNIEVWLNLRADLE